MSYNLIKNIIKKVNSLIIENKFDEAKEEIERIKKSDDFSKYEMEYELLKRKINESNNVYSIETSSLKDELDEFINMGKLNMYYDDEYIAYQYFMAGAYLTDLPNFYYKAAKAMYFYGEYKKAMVLFEKYIEIGYYKLSKAYYYLLKCNRKSGLKKLVGTHKRKEKLDLALAKIGDYDLIKEHSPTNNRSEDYDNFHDYNNKNIDIKDITNNLGLYSDIEKLKTIRLLYQNNYVSLADKYLKKYYKNLSANKDIAREFNKLKLNRKLYINQGKK